MSPAEAPIRETIRDPAARAALRRAVQNARLQFVYSGQPLVLGTSVLLGVLTLVAVRTSENLLALSIWLATLTVLNLWRYRQGGRYRAERAAHTADPVAWERTLLLNSLAAGLVWGLAPLLFMPPQTDGQFFLAFILAGVASGAVTGLAVAPNSVFAFVLPCVLPLAIRFFAAGDSQHRLMGAVTLFYIVAVTLVARRSGVQLIRMVAYQMEAQSHREALSTSEGERRLSNERLRVAAEAGRIGVWEWDIDSGLSRWDAQMYELYRIPLDTGPHAYEVWRERVHPQDLARAEKEWNAALQRQEAYKSEYRIVWPTGEERYIRTCASVLRDTPDHSARFIGIDQDVTEIKRLERIKTEFVSTVSHELRTPVTAIRGALGLVTHDAAGPVSPQALGLLQVAERNVNRLGALIEDLLDVDGLESGKIELVLHPQPLAPLLQQALSASAPYAREHGVQLALSGAIEPLSAAVDPARLLQVMAKLLSNAIKFSPTGASVTVTLAEARQYRARVEIIDRGAGIAPELQPRLFGKFVQGDSTDARSNSGTGLGLAIAKALIEQMGGQIGFESTTGVGTRFFFELPLSSARAPAPIAPETA